MIGFASQPLQSTSYEEPVTVSDNICWVVDLEATLEDASALAQKGLQWLVQQGIAESIPDSGGALSGADLYRPGPKAAAWAEYMADDLRLCGVEVTVERTVFHAGSNSDHIRCPHCGARHGLDAVPWSEAVERWHSGETDYTLACPTCTHSAPIVAWTFLEFDWAFGNLGFGFNNWMIDERLVAELGNVLGHRTKVVYEHI
jgi:hypothetical protein